jgi:hypothetical protein
MTRSLREFVRSVLTEASQESGKTTEQWWSERGVTYTGSQAASPYYVMTDAEGKAVQGNITFPGDPYTYQDTGSGKLRVISGPTQRSIGAVISRGSGAAGEKSGATEAAAAQISNVKKFSAQIVDAVADVVIAASELQFLKSDFLRHQSSLTPETIIQLDQGLVGFFFQMLGNTLGVMDIDALIGSKGFQPLLIESLKSLAKMIEELPSAVADINTQASTSYVRGKLLTAKTKISFAARDLEKIDADSLTDEEKADLGHANEMIQFAGDVLSYEDVVDYFGLNIINPGGGPYTHTALASGGAAAKPERIGGYAPHLLRDQTEKLRSELRSKILSVSQ